MMALQKSLLEQSDIVPMLSEMNFKANGNADGPHGQPGEGITLVVENPPVVSLEDVAFNDE